MGRTTPFPGAVANCLTELLNPVHGLRRLRQRSDGPLDFPKQSAIVISVAMDLAGYYLAVCPFPFPSLSGVVPTVIESRVEQFVGIRHQCTFR